MNAEPYKQKYKTYKIQKKCYLKINFKIEIVSISISNTQNEKKKCRRDLDGHFIDELAYIKKRMALRFVQ